MPKIRPCLAISFLLLGSVGLGACNTAEGVGKDIQSGGEAVQDAAGDAKNALD